MMRESKSVNQLEDKSIAVKQHANKSKALKKQQVFDEVERSVQFVKDHQQGKVKAKSIKELIAEL